MSGRENESPARAAAAAAGCKERKRGGRAVGRCCRRRPFAYTTVYAAALSLSHSPEIMR